MESEQHVRAAMRPWFFWSSWGVLVAAAVVVVIVATREPFLEFVPSEALSQLTAAPLLALLLLVWSGAAFAQLARRETFNLALVVAVVAALYLALALAYAPLAYIGDLRDAARHDDVLQGGE